MERVTGQAGIQALLTGASREDAGSSVHVGLFESLRDCSLRESKLPRKEVIQPHVPLRLPCYDFIRFDIGGPLRVPDITRWQLRARVALVAGLNPTSHDTS